MTINYGDIIRKRRKELGMTQKELADAACVHLSTVKNFERSGSGHLDCFLSIMYALQLQIYIIDADWGDGENPYFKRTWYFKEEE